MTTTTRSGRPQVAVIGGGIAGLSAACTLGDIGVDVTLFEAGDRVGGVIQTEQRGGFLAEAGPNSLAAPPEPVMQLLETVGIASRRIAPAPVAKSRFVVRGGRPIALPTSPGELIRSDLLSTGAKLRLLGEPLVGAAPARHEESVASFVRRRLGGEALDYLADPFVAGIFAGDPERLSIRHALPKLHGLEAQFGSLFKGAIAKGFSKANGPRADTLFTFPDGLAEMPAALARRLEDRIRLNTAIAGIRRVGEGWYLTGDRNQLDPLHRYDGIVLAIPAYRLAGLAWEGIEARPLIDLASIRYVPVASLSLGFPRAAVRHRLDGFGMLVPRVENRKILGTLFTSSLFPGRAPAGFVNLTTLVGGARNPGLALAGQAAIRTAVLGDLEELLGITGAPVFESFRCWPKAIPQYDLGYGEYLGRADRVEREWPTLVLTGNYRDGLSVGDTIMSGIAAAGRVARPLTRLVGSPS